MNNRKNVTIGILAVLLLLTSIWGQVETRKRQELELAKSGKPHQAQIAPNDLESKLKAEASNKQAAAQLEEAKQEVEVLRKRNAELETKAAADSTGEQKQEVLKKQLAQQQAVLEEQEQKLAAVSKAEQAQAKRSQEALAKLQEAEGQLAQLKEKQSGAAAKSEAMHAQIIGLEKMVEERGAAFIAAAKELENCKLNTNILISKIAEQAKQEQKGCLSEPAVKTEEKAKPVEQPPQVQEQQQVQQ